MNNKLNHTSKILYISPEYGFNKNFPNYAGGLGILAGDFLKSASDLDIPIVAVGLLYKNGYFKQSFDDEFNQISSNANLDFDLLDLNLLKINNKTLKLFVIINYQKIYFKIYRTFVNKVELFLLDTCLKENNKNSRITDMLYTPDRKLRLLQEVILGQGAILLMNSLNYNISKVHINEGHAVFSLVERINTFIDNNPNYCFNEVIQLLKTTNFFTTHTPIIHGNEQFNIKLIRETMKDSNLMRHINIDEFIGLAKYKNKFSMTVLALNLSNKYNTVSKLHNQVATEMWKDYNKNLYFHNITNGIYLNEWVSEDFKFVLDSKLLKTDFYEIKKELKYKIIENLNQNNFLNSSNSLKKLYSKTIIDREALIIGFARRFAPYKRANLLFKDIRKLKKLIEKYDNKIYIIFSGKAHPADIEGKKIIKDLLITIKEEYLEKNIIFIENYSIEIARQIIFLSDVWLNNPIRGLEACGTSGMKSALNGGINLSILDGWWDEAYNAANGWSIGDNNINKLSQKSQATIILNTLENQVLPIFFNNKKLWNMYIYNSINTIIKKFSSDRMVLDYNNIFYKS